MPKIPPITASWAPTASTPFMSDMALPPAESEATPAAVRAAGLAALEAARLVKEIRGHVYWSDQDVEAARNHAGQFTIAEAEERAEDAKRRFRVAAQALDTAYNDYIATIKHHREDWMAAQRAAIEARADRARAAIVDLEEELAALALERGIFDKLVKLGLPGAQVLEFRPRQIGLAQSVGANPEQLARGLRDLIDHTVPKEVKRSPSAAQIAEEIGRAATQGRSEGDAPLPMGSDTMGNRY